MAVVVTVNGRKAGRHEPHSLRTAAVHGRIRKELHCSQKGGGPHLPTATIDKVVMMGWLIGDVVLGCKIDKADAHAVGRKASELSPLTLWLGSP